MDLSKVERDLTKLSTAEYKSANEELQRRIKDLREEVAILRRENGDLQSSHTKLSAEVSDLKSKVSYKEEVIRRYQLDGNIVSTKAKPVRNVSKSTSKPQRVQSRKKSIYGILKNKTRYGLSDIEIKFLTDIKDCSNISQKQFDWLDSIKKRLK